MLKKYFFYIIRWQCSTPILALCMYYMNFNITIKTIIANFIGALIFFWVDKYIFKNNVYYPLWEIQDYVEAFAAQAACDAIPRFNVTPRNGQHIPNQTKV